MSWLDALNNLQNQASQYGATAADIMVNRDPVNNLKDAEDYQVALGQETTAASLFSASYAKINNTISQIFGKIG